jgi:hypothetical protein
MLDERIKIPVAVKQGQIVLDTSSGNNGVNRLSYRHTLSPQRAEVSSRLQRDIFTTKGDYVQRGQKSSRLVEVLLAAKTLEYFGQDQVTNSYGFSAQQSIQPLSLRGSCPSEKINPDAGVDNNHLSVLMALRSPSHCNFPLKRRSSSCCRNLKSVRKPNSTASFFVFKPVSRKASLINLSSISMFVRIMCTNVVHHVHASVLLPLQQASFTAWRLTGRSTRTPTLAIASRF